MNETPNESVPGWYWAHGDPVETLRYWDGQQWIGQPVTPLVDDPSTSTKKKRVKVALKIIGRPNVLETEAGFRIQLNVVNKGPIDALVSVEVKVKGSGTIQLLNPQATVQAGAGPVKLTVTAPLDSGLSEGSKVTVSITDQAGTTLAVSSSAAGTSIGVAATATAIIGIGALLVVNQIRPRPEPASDTSDAVVVSGTDALEELLEPEETEQTPADTDAVQSAVTSNFNGAYEDLEWIEDRTSDDSVRLEHTPASIELALLNSADCAPCSYDVLLILGDDDDSFATALGTIEFDENTPGPHQLTAQPGDLLPIVCKGEGENPVPDEAYETIDTTIDLLIDLVGDEPAIDLRIERDYSLPTGPSDGCPSPWTVESLYSNQDATSFPDAEEGKTPTSTDDTTFEEVTPDADGPPTDDDTSPDELQPAACVDGELGLGTEGRRSEIALYQLTLRELGFDPGDIDGYFGQITQQAAFAEIQANGSLAGPNGEFVDYFPDDGTVLEPAFVRLGIACG